MGIDYAQQISFGKPGHALLIPLWTDFPEPKVDGLAPLKNLPAWVLLWHQRWQRSTALRLAENPWGEQVWCPPKNPNINMEPESGNPPCSTLLKEQFFSETKIYFQVPR